MKKNYRLEMEHELEKIRAEQKRPVLVLHTCCAPCSSAVLEQLTNDFQLILYDYNPNISPESEYTHRLEELRRLVREMPLKKDITIAEVPYDPERFFTLTAGHEDDPEGGDRCGICFEMRLRKTAEYAAEIGADYFTTTLSISPLKNAERLNVIGGKLAEEYGVRYLYSDFKKNNGYRRSCELSAQYGLYRQNYCGCIYSKEERENPVTEGAVKRALTAETFGRNYEWHEIIDSTNERAKVLAREGAPHGTVVSAESQTAGKGRFDRRFWSPGRGGIYVSVILRPDMPAADATLVTPMAAVAVARATDALIGLESKIKWVNDVYLNGKKICGILCESEFDPRTGKLRYIVAGIGVNVAKIEFPEELRDKATSLENESGRHIRRSRFIAELLDRLEELYRELPGSDFMKEYIARSCVIGNDVTVLRGDEAYPARAVGIDPEGSLIVQKEDGAQEALRSGEISIRL